MKTPVFIVTFLMIVFVCNAQRDSSNYFSAEAGISLSIGKELSKVYDFGGRITAAASFPAFSQKWRVRPFVSGNYFGNNYNKATRDNLVFWNLGSSIELNPRATVGIKIVPHAGLFYLIGKNVLTPRKDYQGDPTDLFKFRGIGFDAGVRMVFTNNFFLNLSLQLANPKGDIDDDIKDDLRDELDADSELYEVIQFPRERFSFHALTLTIGFNFPKR
jgi:hypothetical protein